MSVRGAWRGKWNLARAIVAGVVVWTLAIDTAPRMARLQLASLPDADYVKQVDELVARGRYAEAMVIADAGLVATSGAEHDRLAAARERVVERQQSVLRRLKDLARGAITGGAGGGENSEDASLELLLGAVATDLFVVGDIRDLIIQGGRWARGQKPDVVIAALAGVGVATTLAPEVDWAPSVLKVARKVGAMPASIGEFITAAAKQGDTGAIRRVIDDTSQVAKAASPAGAVRIMRQAESVEDLASVARFLDKTGASGAHALAVTGKRGPELLRSAEALRAAGKADEAIATERLLVALGGKGRAGARFMDRGLHRVLLRPHPIVGLIKSVYKGNAQALLARALDLIDPYARWALPAAAAWLFVEMAILFRRIAGGGTRRSENPSAANRARMGIGAA